MTQVEKPRIWQIGSLERQRVEERFVDDQSNDQSEITGKWGIQLAPAWTT